ncbi:MAG: pyridoxamine 5'-phosphate oxidase family protein [Acidimicrobiaceae bacterium]|jgi:PPOX class probable F420-dependent enzyme|nr:pyridoxamine 5'-phosphate oxidase family protein [Ilumatobacteraceae bacterium]
MGTLSMTPEEREQFLADLHVGVLAIERPDGPPLTVPVWYIYEPGGELWFLTSLDSVKGRLLQKSMRFSLCAQSESLPYKYVSIEGAATISTADKELHSRPMAHRYLGVKEGDKYVERGDGEDDGESMRISTTPERWFTVDYSKF